MPLTRAVIVEPREHPALEYVLRNVLLRVKVPITIVHGTSNPEFCRRIVKRVDPDRISLLSINRQNLTSSQYSQLLLSNQFWDNFKNEDQVLIFQTDAGICGDTFSTVFSNELEMYDYCAAPSFNIIQPHYERLCLRLFLVTVLALGALLAHKTESTALKIIIISFSILCACVIYLISWLWPRPDHAINGGFSLRRVSAMQEIIRQNKHRFQPDDAEDVKLVEGCINKSSCSLCPLSIAKRFSIDTASTDKSVLSWAFHKQYEAHVASGCHAASEVERLNM